MEGRARHLAIQILDVLGWSCVPVRRYSNTYSYFLDGIPRSLRPGSARRCAQPHPNTTYHLSGNSSLRNFEPEVTKVRR
ncbi:hypothetical protein E2C01_042299 [Portunus trituberculatus]|uniref:Uncharacterized protein n=1 Tax=Portunus trituberculatus TaxID=210409 RepID=A0A5B7FT97_PORTR|nr:hypothetical protein [Portunus trituberculatus]